MQQNTVPMTQLLIDIIKTTRKTFKIRGDSLSLAINKSPAYISHLEKGKIANIDINMLHDIFNQLLILSNNSAGIEVKNLLLQINPEELITLLTQNWFVVLDEVFSYQEINENIIDYINKKIENLKITEERVIQKLNANESLDNPEQYDCNKLYISTSYNSIGTSIRYNLPLDFIENILNKKIPHINYVNMIGIVNALILLETPDIKNSVILARKTLQNLKYFSPVQELERKKSVEDSDTSDNEKKYRALLDEVSKIFSALKKHNIEHAIKKLEYFILNSKSDLGLTVAVMSLPIFTLNSLEKEKKQKLLEEFLDLILKYSKVNIELEDIKTEDANE